MKTVNKTVAEVVSEWDAHRTIKYRFYIEVPDSEGKLIDVEWTGLKLNEAKTLYRLTNKHCNVARTGWEEVK